MKIYNFADLTILQSYTVAQTVVEINQVKYFTTCGISLITLTICSSFYLSYLIYVEIILLTKLDVARFFREELVRSGKIYFI